MSTSGLDPEQGGPRSDDRRPARPFALPRTSVTLLTALALVAAAILHAAPPVDTPDPWLGKTFRGWDHDTGNAVAIVGNPAGIGRFKEGEICGLGNEWEEKVLAPLDPGWYLDVITWNQPARLDPKAPAYRRTPHCPKGTLTTTTRIGLEQLAGEINERDQARRRAKAEAERAVKRRALIRELLRKTPGLAHLPP